VKRHSVGENLLPTVWLWGVVESPKGPLSHAWSVVRLLGRDASLRTTHRTSILLTAIFSQLRHNTV
jgi:hypothetical protein